jgi:hypothetical protein
MAEQCDDLVHRSGVFGPQLEILGGDAHRARVEVALADHLAAESQQRKGPEAEALSPQQRSHDHVPTGAQAAVGLQDDL